MVFRLVAAGALMLAFALGYFLALPQEDEGTLLLKQMEKMEIDNAALTINNNELRETLGLIRRQIQTDRIAYDALKRTMDESERQRELMQEKLSSQRELLERLKKKIEEL